MKKPISILLIFSIITPLWIFYSIIQYEKYATKKEIKKFLVSNIDKNKLVLLKFSSEETKSKLKWEHSKEFEYNGEMYDIIEKEIRIDSVYYWCWHDSKETKLNKQLESLVNQASSRDPKNTEKSQRLMSFFYSFFTNFSYDNSHFDNEEISILFSRYLFIYTSQFIIPDTPPPKRIVS